MEIVVPRGRGTTLRPRKGVSLAYCTTVCVDVQTMRAKDRNEKYKVSALNTGGYPSHVYGEIKNRKKAKESIFEMTDGKGNEGT